MQIELEPSDSVENIVEENNGLEGNMAEAAKENQPININEENLIEAPEMVNLQYES